MKAKSPHRDQPYIAIDASFGPVRLALVEAGRLVDYYEDWPDTGRLKGNLYRGVIRKVDARLDAAFVRFGAEKDGFLPAKDLEGLGQAVPKAGDAILVQVVKDPVGAKGAVLTTRLSYSGRGLVFMPLKEGAGGVSTRLEGEEREQLRGVLKSLSIPAGGSVILRTAALGKSQEELQSDLDRLALAHREASDFCDRRKEPGLVAREAPPAVRYLREYLRPGIDTIWVSDEAVHRECLEFLSRDEPRLVSALRQSPDGPQMFDKLGLESQIEALSLRKVALPSGANIVIDTAEALVAIDVNSGGLKAKKNPAPSAAPVPEADPVSASEGGLEPPAESEMHPEAPGKPGRGRERPINAEHEATALMVNLEAAEEVARQLRLRDLGGIVVIDFIDMESAKNRERVEQALRRALSRDKAKIRVYPISPLGTLELSRQRLRKTPNTHSEDACEACGGAGRLESSEGQALRALRQVDARSRQKKSPIGLAVRVPWPVANELWARYRVAFSALETRFPAGLQLQALPDRNAPIQILETTPAPVARGVAPKPAKGVKPAGETEAVADAAVPAVPVSDTGRENPAVSPKPRRGFRRSDPKAAERPLEPKQGDDEGPAQEPGDNPSGRRTNKPGRSRRRRPKAERSGPGPAGSLEGRATESASTNPPSPGTDGGAERSGRRRRRRSSRKKKE